MAYDLHHISFSGGRKSSSNRIHDVLRTDVDNIISHSKIMEATLPVRLPAYFLLFLKKKKGYNCQLFHSLRAFIRRLFASAECAQVDDHVPLS